jgi:hypothetical protein
MRSDFAAAACDQSCVIHRGTSYTGEPQGGGTTTDTVIATVLAGMSEPTSGQLTNYGFLVAARAAWQVKFAYGTDVLEDDTLFIGGKKLIVAKVLTPRSYAALLTALATEV